MEKLDYRLLLYKYMGVVVEEGDHDGYLGYIDKNRRHHDSYNQFTTKEMKELYKILLEHEEKANFPGYG